MPAAWPSAADWWRVAPMLSPIPQATVTASLSASSGVVKSQDQVGRYQDEQQRTGGGGGGGGGAATAAVSRAPRIAGVHIANLQ